MSIPHMFRKTPRTTDVAAVERMAAGTGFFRDDEVRVAVELVEERLAKGPESGYFFLFADGPDDQIRGYVCYGPIPCAIGSYDLYWIVVDKEHQGRGLGKRLLEEAEEAMRRAGGRRVYIETSGKAKYDPTRSFYCRCGYGEAAALVDFYAPGDDKIIFCKELGF